MTFWASDSLSSGYLSIIIIVQLHAIHVEVIFNIYPRHWPMIAFSYISGAVILIFSISCISVLVVDSLV